MKKLIIITSAILLLAAACNKQAAVQPASNSQPAVDQTANWKIYTNDKYGFKLVFTDNWKGYKTVQNTKSLTSPIIELIDFVIPSVGLDKVYDVRPFGIVVLNGTKWNSTEDIVNDLGPVGSYLAKNDKYTFAYYTTQDPVGIPSNVLSEMRAVANTFKFTK